jgi:8-oxo-dGTP pyrophosphatase MutT (NUDIX family)
LSRIARVAEALAARAPRTVTDSTRALAAVDLVFVPDPDAILLIRRAEREGDRWSGQMAFPGGRWSPEDHDLLATARRETAEEVGVDLAAARLLGRLDDSAPRSPTLPPIIVTPFVFALDRRQPLSPNHEVAGALWAPLESLLAPGVYRPFHYEALGTRMSFPGYHLDEGTVWGMTERILTPLLELLD